MSTIKSSAENLTLNADGANNDVIIQSNGSTKVTVDGATGNVGIGTSSPATKLDISGTAGITSFTGTTKLGVVSRGSTGATDYSGYDFIGNTQSNPVARVGVITTGGGSKLSFGTSNAYASGITNTAMTIDQVGNVGIGTSSPILPLSIKASQEQLTISEGDTRGGTFDYRSSTGNLQIATNGANARSAPQLTLNLNGDITANTGNLVIGTSGKGIDFSANGNAGGMTSEVLDDYEEGTWTLGVSGGSQTFSPSEVVYTKIGRVVHINAYGTPSNVSDTASLILTGLPFAATSYNSIGVLQAANSSSSEAILMRTIANSTNLQAFYAQGNQTTVQQAVTHGHWIFSLSYITSA